MLPRFLIGLLSLHPAFTTIPVTSVLHLVFSTSLVFAARFVCRCFYSFHIKHYSSIRRAIDRYKITSGTISRI